MATTEKQCIEKGWDWNAKTKKCTMPRIGAVKLTIPRGAGCDGTEERETHGKKLSLPTRKALLKAAASRRRTEY